jgi:RimJ/RimL family protein N-acetyltransferase
MIAAVLTSTEPTPLLPAQVADKDSRAFTVRSLGPGDRAALDAFYLTFEPARAAQGLPPQGAQRIARWLDRILGSGLHLAVEEAGRLVGHAMLIPTDDERVREYAIFLHQHVRGHGLGTEINRLAIDLARAQGIIRLWLSVEPENRPAVRSYEKAGWKYIPASLYSPELEMELKL